MPTVFRIGSFRFFFFSDEGSEPIHIHVQRDNSLAKFWIKPEISLASSIRFSAVELRKIHKYIEENKNLIEEKWNEHFGI
ncbi:DUF4160 domain-containing protein [Okeania sp.]|uniref:DUF4160 domain-containing protein n=1 Tax=Okeania sp. TaxID=3100323 RepID=UPI002B4ADB0B|nr:DUF4160 domain-containing protein [Okeania sp.]MEB3342997.1 DUF4160 domain-containing protein [Okeania sp.]